MASDSVGFHSKRACGLCHKRLDSQALVLIISKMAKLFVLFS